ncbi:MAG: methyl-accepting chemotaxis protein [Proteobacteria bacterium]|nr:methyl-accepting chemotaxis protein [Pseudomonadota bacterium]
MENVGFINSLKIRTKLGISCMVLAVIPFLAVCLIAVFYFQNDKEKDIGIQIASNLDSKARYAETYFLDLKAWGEAIGMINSSTRELLTDLFQYHTQDHIMRASTIENKFGDIQQSMKADVRRIVLIMNAKKKDGEIVGEIVFSAKKEAEEEKPKEETFELKKRLSNGLQLRGKGGQLLSRLWSRAREKKISVVHAFETFEGDYSFYITVPILVAKGFFHSVPNADRSDSYEDDSEEVKEIESDIMGMVVLQIDPLSLSKSIRDYFGMGEIFLVRRNSQGDGVLLSRVEYLKSEGEVLEPGQMLPEYAKRVFETADLITIESHLMAKNDLDEIDGLSLSLVADIDRGKVFAPISNLQRLFWILGIIGFVIIGAAVFFIARTFSDPLKKLSSALNEIRESGDFSLRPEAKSQDEIGQTVNSVNELLNSLQSAIGDIDQVMGGVAQGDMKRQVTVELKGNLDNLKRSINTSIDMLGSTISDVVIASRQVQSGVGEISTSAGSLANGTASQAASLEEVSSTMNEIGTQIKDNSENAIKAQQLTLETLDVVQQGNKQMGNMQISMQKINETSTNVSKVGTVIDKIASQTNLLALNAAVEAARAGKYGKGFAVVADEVRSLASRSTEAARDTTELIENAIKEVENGVSNSDQTAEILADIVIKVETINDLVGGIAAVSKEQNTGIEEINNGLTQINDVVQQNSAISEETASAATQLSSLTLHLQEIIQKFHLRERRLESDMVSDERMEYAPSEQLMDSNGQSTKQLSHQPDDEKEFVSVMTIED